MRSTYQSKMEVHRPDFLKVLSVRADASKDRKAIPPSVAGCNHGHYERTRWLIKIERELGQEGPVKLVCPKQTENCLRVDLVDEVIDFRLLFGKMESPKMYSIHTKGSESEMRSTIAPTFDFDGEGETRKREVMPYALSIEMVDDERTWFELHFVLGSRSDANSVFTESIVAYGRYIVRPEGTPELVEAYNPPFNPVVK